MAKTLGGRNGCLEQFDFFLYPPIGCFLQSTRNGVNCGTLIPLTLTLFRGEREQPLDTSLLFNATRQKAGADLPGDWKQFSLSSRERGGVRGKYVDFQSVSSGSALERRATAVLNVCEPDFTAAERAKVDSVFARMPNTRIMLSDLVRRRYDLLAFGPRAQGAEKVTKTELETGRNVEAWIREGTTLAHKKELNHIVMNSSTDVCTMLVTCRVAVELENLRLRDLAASPLAKSHPELLASR